MCSPGRWTAGARTYPVKDAVELRSKLWECFKGAARCEAGAPCDPVGLLARLAAGRYKENPFEETALRRARGIVEVFVGMEGAQAGVADGQPFRLDLIGGLLEAFEDPDAEFIRSLKDGVALGVDEEMPRTPAVFEEKVKWNLGYLAEGGERQADNYRSVNDHLGAVKELFEQEQKLGWMEEMSVEEATERFGNRLYVAALAVVEEPNKIRVVHDGSNTVQVNH